MRLSNHLRALTSIIACAALGLCLAGCASHSSATGDAGVAHQMRYYGGPKSPMWPNQ